MSTDRVAVVKLSQQEMEQLLELPAGYRLVGVHDDWTHRGVALLIESDAFEPSDPVAVPPVVMGMWQWDADARRMRWTPPFGGAS